MKNLLTRFFKSKKAMLTAFAVTALALTGTTAFAGWGIDRPTYDYNNAADRVGSTQGPVFNSFINTPYYGDERAFLDSKDAANTNPGGFADATNVEDGKEYLVRMYIHNNANEATNETGVGVAKDTKVRFKVLNDLGNINGVTAFLSASNDKTKAGTPVNGELWDTTDLKNVDRKFTLSYVPGSAEINNKWHPNGLKLSDEIVNGGVLIGDDNMDGNYNGCFQYQSYVTIRVKVTMPKLEISKKVRLAGTKEWMENVNAKPGDTLQWLIEVKNTGTIKQTDAVAQELLPPHVEYIADTAKWFNSEKSNIPYNFDQLEISDGDGGFIFGDYAPGGNFLVRFDTKVLGDFTPCTMYIRNLAYAKSNENPALVKDSADVTITKENCVPPTPKYACDLLDVTRSDNRTVTVSQLKTTATDGATYNKAVINWGDTKSNEYTNAVGQAHQYTTDGTYKVVATAYFTVNGETKSATSVNCEKTVTFSPAPVVPKYACEVLGITVKGREVEVTNFNTTQDNATFKHAIINWGDNTSPLTTNLPVGQKHTYSNDGSYKVVATAYFTVNGETKSATSVNCEKTVAFKVNTPPQVLSTSTSLPKTGASEVAIAAAVVTATILGTVGHAIVTSRRA